METVVLFTFWMHLHEYELEWAIELTWILKDIAIIAEKENEMRQFDAEHMTSGQTLFITFSKYT